MRMYGKAAAVVAALALALTGCGSVADSNNAPAEDAPAASEEQKAIVQINTEGVGQIAWAYENDEIEFDEEYPFQSAYVSDAFGQTIHIEAKEDPSYEGYHFVKWNKDGKKFSEDKRIDVLVDGDAEYVAVFEYKDESGEEVTQYTYGDSEVYEQADIDAAFDTIMAEFDSWGGATMRRIAFTDDATCEADLEYCNSLREDGDPEFTQAIVIMSDFHSPAETDGAETGLEPDTDYEDWSWHLARTDGGEWKLLTWGYE